MQQRGPTRPKVGSSEKEKLMARLTKGGKERAHNEIILETEKKTN